LVLVSSRHDAGGLTAQSASDGSVSPGHLAQSRG
jgi:hypothetical protein